MVNLLPKTCRAELKRLINKKVVESCWLFTSLNGWLFVCLNPWPAGRSEGLVGWLVGWLAIWLFSWLAGCFGNSQSTKGAMTGTAVRILTCISLNHNEL